MSDRSTPDPAEVASLWTIERRGGVSNYGKPLTLVGPERKPGDVVANPPLVANDLSSVVLGNAWGRPRLISFVPSIDTPVCDRQTRHFDELVADKDGSPELCTVSMDLPFAQGRFRAAVGIRHQLLSAHRDGAFGVAYGVLIKELRLLARAVFVIDPGGKIVHVEYVRDLAIEPDYDAALAASTRLG